MLVGRSKLSPEEKFRRSEMLKTFRPGLKLVFIHSDYHEDDETPHGFFEAGDEVTLLFVVDVRPVVESGTGKVVDHCNEWVMSSRYGLEQRADYYLASMTKVKDETQG